MDNGTAASPEQNSQSRIHTHTLAGTCHVGTVYFCYLYNRTKITVALIVQLISPVIRPNPQPQLGLLIGCWCICM